MKIELHEISIREVTQSYVDNAEEGVVGYGGRLNIRPKYQREYIYDAAKRVLFSVGAVETLSVRQSSVGVNTTSPAYALDVAGAGRVSQQAIVDGTMTVAGSAFSVGGSTLAIAAGKVGVGLSNPQGTLEIYSGVNNYEQLLITNPNSDTAIAFKKGGVARGVGGAAA